jgi:hypothetical protein
MNAETAACIITEIVAAAVFLAWCAIVIALCATLA